MRNYLKEHQKLLNSVVAIKVTNKIIDIFRPLSFEDKWKGIKPNAGSFGIWHRCELRSSGGHRIIRGHKDAPLTKAEIKAMMEVANNGNVTK